MVFIASIFSSQAIAEIELTQFQHSMPVIKENRTFDELTASMNGAYCAPSPTATRFYFVRHGESLGNREKIYAGQTLDVDLTEQGERDAMRAGQTFKALQEKEGWAFDHVFSSPSLRALRTTEIALSQVIPQGREFQTDARLREKHIGVFDGKPMDADYTRRTLKGEAEIEQLESFWERLNYKHNPADPQEESLRQVFDRVVQFLLEKNGEQAFQGAHVFVGSHGGVLKTLLMAHAAIHHGVILDYHRFEAPNGSLLIIEVEGGNLKVIQTSGFKYRNVSKHAL